MQMVDSDDASVRARAATILGEIGIRNFYRPLLKLLRDPDGQVRMAALDAAPKIGNPAVWPEVVSLLDLDAAAVQAANALVKIGDAALPHLATVFEGNWSAQARVRAAQVAGRIKGEQGIALLARQVAFPDRSVRDQVLVALAACGYQAPGSAGELVWQCVRDEAAHSAWICSCLAQLWWDDLIMLQRALTTERKKSRDHVLLLLSFVCPSNAILRARENLRTGSPDKRGYALEVLDNLLAPAMKSMLLAVVEDLPVVEVLLRLSDVLPQPKLSPQEAVDSVMGRQAMWISEWTRATAVDAAARLEHPERRQRIAFRVPAPSPGVAATAVTALSEV